MPWLDTVNHFLFWGLAILLLVDLNFLLFHGGIPNIRTAPAIRKKYIELIHADMLARRPGEPYTIVDLGSGNGLVTRDLARAIPEAHIIGVEIARQSVWWSNMMKRLCRIPNLEYRRMSFLDFDFSEADAVTMYLLAYFMQPVKERLETTAKPATLVISNKFYFADWEPEETFEVQTRYPHQKKVYVYRTS